MRVFKKDCLNWTVKLLSGFGSCKLFSKYFLKTGFLRQRNSFLVFENQLIIKMKFSIKKARNFPGLRFFLEIQLE